MFFIIVLQILTRLASITARDQPLKKQNTNERMEGRRKGGREGGRECGPGEGAGKGENTREGP